MDLQLNTDSAPVPRKPFSAGLSVAVGAIHHWIGRDLIIKNCFAINQSFIRYALIKCPDVNLILKCIGCNLPDTRQFLS